MVNFMKIYNQEVKTIYWVQLSESELNEAVENYYSDEGLQIIYPKAKQSFEREDVKSKYNFNSDAMFVFARYFGFDKWENAGYFSNGVLRCCFSNYGDCIN